ncbi:MAG: hypothetical protein EP297_02130 [Gammaproteobacteria bacterium]|nr:MAG: hypothetical protein EP297_02130 [Gammaproteobacteria bacterium]
MKTLIRILVSTAILGGLLAVPTAVSAAAPAAEKAPVATAEKAPAPAAEKATEVAKTEAATDKRPAYRSRIDRIRDRLDRRRGYLGDRYRFRHYGPGDDYRHWSDQRHQAMMDWADFRNEDYKRYVSARNFWNNPWAETRRQVARQRSDAMRAYMEDMHQRHTDYIDSIAPPIYRGGFYDYDPFLY